MTTIPMSRPSAQDILGDSIHNYPDDYMFPYTVLIREAFRFHRDEFEAGATFVTPGYGTLVTKGRDYVFTPLRGYAASKGYGDEVVGVWE